MTLSRTLSAYMSRQFLAWFGIVFTTMLAMVALIDSIELLRRAAKTTDAGISVVLSMELLRLAHLGEQIAPFAVLFGGILAMVRMTRSHELIIARAAGVSVWQFLLPILVLAFALGVAKITLLNPLAAITLERYEEMEGRYFTGRSSLLAVSRTGIWLRQVSKDGDVAVIHADGVDANAMRLDRVIVFLLKANDRFAGRIDARSAQLGEGSWILRDAIVTGPERDVERVSTYRFATDLTPETIQESFASPDTISFWSLPRFIRVLEATGFSAVAHRLQWNALLSEPFLYMAMVLIAATVSLRFRRTGGNMLPLGGGVVTSFTLFVVTDIVYALGQGASIPILLAAWTPAGVSSMLGVSMLLHLEDG